MPELDRRLVLLARIERLERHAERLARLLTANGATVDVDRLVETLERARLSLEGRPSAGAMRDVEDLVNGATLLLGSSASG